MSEKTPIERPRGFSPATNQTRTTIATSVRLQQSKGLLMKKTTLFLISCLMAVTLSACSNNYEDVVEALEQDTWYFNGGSNTTLKYLDFQSDSASLGEVHFDGHGANDDGSETYSYAINKSEITLSTTDGSELLTIPYEMEAGTLTLEQGYFSSADVKEGLLGYWRCRYTEANILGDVFTTEYNVYIDENHLTREYANEGYGLADGEYYYSEPTEISYSLTNGGLDFNRGWFEYGFNIIDNQVVLMQFDRAYARGGGFRGINGYSF